MRERDLSKTLKKTIQVYLNLTINQSPVQQRIVNKSFKHGHHAVFVGTQYTHNAFTGHSVITINASHLKEKKIKRTKPLTIPSTT